MPDQDKDGHKDREKEREKDREKEKLPVAIEPTDHHASAVAAPPAKTASELEEAGSHYFFGEPLVGFDPAEITGTLVVIEGMDGSGRSTQITLLQEWLESEGFAVQTSGLRRSNLVGRDIDQLLAKNAVTRLTLALMYATDFFDQVEHRILPALTLRHGRARRPFYFHSHRPRRGPRHQSRLHERPLRHGSPPAPHLSGSTSAPKPPSAANSKNPRPSVIGKPDATCPSLTISTGLSSATRP